VESREPIGPQPAALTLSGVTQHVAYTGATERRALAEASTGPRGTRAVMIAVAKSEAWWNLAQDQRHAHFRTRGGREGHTAIGLPFVDRIHRRLYHARYLPGSTWDFLTYFEFQREHARDFRALLAALRDPERNPEWTYVDREWEVWMTRT
jgi:hypothetical protein